MPEKGYTDVDVEKYTSPTPADSSYESFKNLLGAQAGKLAGIDLTKPRVTTEPSPVLKAEPSPMDVESTLPTIRRSDVPAMSKQGHVFTDQDFRDLYGPSREETATLPSRAMPETTLPPSISTAGSPYYEQVAYAQKPVFTPSSVTRQLEKEIKSGMLKGKAYDRAIARLAFSQQADRESFDREMSAYTGYMNTLSGTRTTDLLAKQFASAFGLTEANVANIIADIESKRATTKTLPPSYEEAQAGKERLAALAHPPKDITGSILDAATKFAGHFKDPVTGAFNQEAYEAALPGLINSLKKHGLIPSNLESAEKSVSAYEQAIEEAEEARRKKKWEELLEEGQTIRRNPQDQKLYVISPDGEIVRPYW